MAIPGAYFCARLSGWVGNIKALGLIVFVWIFVCAYAYTVTSQFNFYLLATAIGFVMGGIQSNSRATYAKLCPKGEKDTASYFSFYDVCDRMSTVIGTFMFGLVIQLTGNMRISILVLVVVFGASNFPFAYSTAGGDTASAFAAGCPVLVKAHPAHEKTSTFIANLIFSAAQKCGVPKGMFAHIYGKDFKVGKQLVMHPNIKAVGFTGSYIGGKQLVNWANERKEPIPVFAEMGSTNPVFLLQEKLNNERDTYKKDQ